MCTTCLSGKCAGGMFLIAGVLLWLISFGVFSSWLNLTSFFGTMFVLAGIHGLFCKCCSESCEMPKKK